MNTNRWMVLAVLGVVLAIASGCDETEPQVALAIGVEGDGASTIAPAPGTYMYDYGATVQIQVEPDDESYVSGWSTGCSGDSCTVVLTGDTTVRVTVSRKRPNLHPLNRLDPLIPLPRFCGGSSTVTSSEPLIRITNNGSVPIRGPVVVHFGVWDGFSDSYWVLQEWTDFTNNRIWYPGATYEVYTISYSLGCNIPQGIYRYTIHVDPHNSVIETDESDNVSNGVIPFPILHGASASSPSGNDELTVTTTK